MPNTKVSESLALVGQQNGVVIIPAGTPLTRLNYFDGKFLRASDLKAEQDYLRQLVNQSNQAGGSGVAYGYDLTIGGGDTLDIGPGLAIDLQGRVLLLPKETSINIQELIDKSRALQSFLSTSQVQRDGSFEQCQLSRETPVVNPLVASDLFVITISQTEALCGEEDVFGKLCEEACVTSTDRPFVVEGVTVRVIPLALQTPLSNSKAFPLTGLHLRSRVASAYFEDERRRIAGLISKAGLEQAVWCLGADAESGGGVPIGVIAREGIGNHLPRPVDCAPRTHRRAGQTILAMADDDAPLGRLPRPGSAVPMPASRPLQKHPAAGRRHRSVRRSPQRNQ